MKSRVLTFLAGVAVGAGIFKLSADLSGTAGSEKELSQSPIQRSSQSRSRSGSSALHDSRTTHRASDGQDLNPGTLLARIEELRAIGNIEVADLKIARLFADIGSLSANETRQLLLSLEVLEENEQWFDPFEEISGTVALRLIELDGLRAVQELENNRYPAFMERFGEDFGSSLMTFWTNHDPEAARDWLLSESQLDIESRGPLSSQLEEDGVLENFFLTFENKRPGESMDIVAELAPGDQHDEFMAHALNARIQLASEETSLTGVLEEGMGLVESHVFNNLLESAVERDGQATRNWVANMGIHPFAERSILTVG